MFNEMVMLWVWVILIGVGVLGLFVSWKFKVFVVIVWLVFGIVLFVGLFL